MKLKGHKLSLFEVLTLLAKHPNPTKEPALRGMLAPETVRAWTVDFQYGHSFTLDKPNTHHHTYKFVVHYPDEFAEGYANVRIISVWVNENPVTGELTALSEDITYP